MSWLAVRNGPLAAHVIPLDDLRPHAELVNCWCRPTNDDGVWVHHALDGREAYEQGRLAQ